MIVNGIEIADFLAKFGFDNQDRPAAGTPCAACKLRGHHCPAKGTTGGWLPLCLECGVGESCQQAKAIERSNRGFDEFEMERSPAECRSIAIPDAARVVTETSPVSLWPIKSELDPENLKGTGIPKTNLRWSNGSPRPKRTVPEPEVAEEVKVEETMAEKQKMDVETAKAKAVEMFKGGAKIYTIAVATGYTWHGVEKWLEGAGLLKISGKKAKGAKAAAPKDLMVKAVPAVATVSVAVSERHLDNFWATCSLEQKAVAFAAVIGAA